MSTQNWGGGADPWQQVLQDVQSSYRNARVTYREPDEFADDSVTWKQIRPHAVRAANVALVLSLATFVILCCTCGVFFNAGTNADSIEGLTLASGGAMITIPVVIGLAFTAWVVTLFFPIKEPIAEYALVVEGKAAAGAAAYGYMLQSAGQRALPFRMGPVRVAGQYLLTLGDTQLQSLLSVQTYGTDLYFGWTMWRSRSTIVLIGHTLRDGFRAMAGGTAYRSAITGGRIRALREITHSVTRLGVQTAIMNLAATQETNRLVEITPEAPMPTGLPPLAPPGIAPMQQPVTGAWPQVHQPPTGSPMSAPPMSAPPMSAPPYPPHQQ
ncbi:hypothetical protein KZZ52_05490 [Dactylosporangium sp. AC04546]|uniref:hypothetical protein n=1 Tax=Dactylosporangium sp. AC04546 TaxID=2862460 RepID=UPI001EDE8D63|nr:hypothetical protein [Dactylosporangium sp. AC04546]WVK84860.1 hypothetical protein KZZ52_05490 [Dactylosporangium sp. AC04546]